MGVEASVIFGIQIMIIYLAFRGSNGELEDTFVDSLLAIVSLSSPGLPGCGKLQKGS
jgi:hypothetical protein